MPSSYALVDRCNIPKIMGAMASHRNSATESAYPQNSPNVNHRRLAVGSLGSVSKHTPIGYFIHWCPSRRTPHCRHDGEVEPDVNQACHSRLVQGIERNEEPEIAVRRCAWPRRGHCSRCVKHERHDIDGSGFDCTHVGAANMEES